MIDIVTNDNRSDVMDRMQDGVSMPCVICGRPCKDPKYLVRLFWGTTAVTDEEAQKIIAEEGSGGDLHFYPIGTACLKAHPELKPYVDDATAANKRIVAQLLAE